MNEIRQVVIAGKIFENSPSTETEEVLTNVVINVGDAATTTSGTGTPTVGQLTDNNDQPLVPPVFKLPIAENKAFNYRFRWTLFHRPKYNQHVLLYNEKTKKGDIPHSVEGFAVFAQDSFWAGKPSAPDHWFCLHAGGEVTLKDQNGSLLRQNESYKIPLDVYEYWNYEADESQNIIAGRSMRMVSPNVTKLGGSNPY